MGFHRSEYKDIISVVMIIVKNLMIVFCLHKLEKLQIKCSRVQMLKTDGHVQTLALLHICWGTICHSLTSLFLHVLSVTWIMGCSWWLSSKDSVLANEGDAGLIPGSGRSPGEGNGNPLQYSCLGNPMDRGAWWATVHRVIMESDGT